MWECNWSRLGFRKQASLFPEPPLALETPLSYPSAVLLEAGHPHVICCMKPIVMSAVILLRVPAPPQYCCQCLLQHGQRLRRSTNCCACRHQLHFCNRPFCPKSNANTTAASSRPVGHRADHHHLVQLPHCKPRHQACMPADLSMLYQWSRANTGAYHQYLSVFILLNSAVLRRRGHPYKPCERIPVRAHVLYPLHHLIQPQPVSMPSMQPMSWQHKGTNHWPASAQSF